MQQESESATLAALGAAARGIGECMLTTVSEDGPLASRPMKVNAADDDGTFWFFASASSGTVRAILRDARVALAFSSGTTRLAVTGEAEIIDDAQSREHHWSLKDRSFIADDPHDPNLVLFRVRSISSRSWGSPSSALNGHGRPGAVPR